MRTLLASCAEDINFFLEKWVYCKVLYYEGPDLIINHLDLVHEQDREKVIQKTGLGILYCEAIEGNYLILRSFSETYHLLPSAIYMILPKPEFVFNDHVQEIARPKIHGLIYNLIWHGNDEEYKYYILVNNRKKSRRYSPSELQKIPPPSLVSGE